MLHEILGNQHIHILQGLCGFLLAPIVPFGQHFQVGNMIFLLEDLQKDVGVNTASLSPGNQANGKGERRQQTQRLSMKKNFRGTLFELQLPARGGKGGAQNEPLAQMPLVDAFLVLVGMSRLYPGSQPPAGGDACGRCRCAAERNSMSGQGNLLPGSVGPGPAAVPGRGRGMTETENL